MKRLLDMPASSPVLEQAQRLIEAAPSVDDSTEQMLRLRRALDQPAARGAILRAPAFVLGGALVVFGASAFAAVRVWVEHRAPHEATEQRADTDTPSSSPLLAAAPETPQPSAAAPEVERVRAEASAVASAGEPGSEVSPRAHVKPAPKASRVRRPKAKASRATRRSASRVAHVAPVASAVVPETTAAVPAEEEATSATVDSIAAAPTAARAARVQPEPERVSQLSAAESDDEREEAEVSEPEVSAAVQRSSDSELVVRAVRALRRDRDPVAASRLLDRYRSRNPRGVLAEEVLSLQIEAALGAKDARAASYAREYLSRYPEGRYRARAQGALSGRVP